MKKYLFIFIICFFNINAQVSICNLIDDDLLKNTISCLSRNSNVNRFSEDVLRKITDEIGISYNFTFINCPNTKNAGAIINPFQNNQRYIVFDSNYFKNLYNSDQSSFYFILAHEIGHHINGHTIPKANTTIVDKQQQELEADYFAGFILYKIGATENDIIKTIRLLPEPKTDYETHPKNNKRLEFALLGYKNEEVKQRDQFYRIKANVLKQKDEEFVNKVTNIEQQMSAKITMDKYDELVKNLEAYKKTNSIKYLNIAEYFLTQLDEKTSFIEEIEAYINFEKGDYLNAFEYYKKLYFKTRKAEDLGIVLEILSKTNTKSQDVLDELFQIQKFSKDPNKLLEAGIYYMQVGEIKSGREIFKKAYEVVKNSDDNLLKSDILTFYGRILFDEKVNQNSLDFEIPKNLFAKSLSIIEKYPNDLMFRKYYDTLLFYLANINLLNENYSEAIEYYNKLLKLENLRHDYYCKSISNLVYIYDKKNDQEHKNELLTLLKENCK